MATQEKYEWSGGLPVITYSDLYEWSDGLIHIVYSASAVSNIKKFADSGLGVDAFILHLLIDNFTDIGSGAEVLHACLVIDFSDIGAGSENLKTLKSILFPESGLGAEILQADKLVIITEVGSGLDVFLRDKNDVGYYDDGSGQEIYKAQYPYPKELKRVVIRIRGLK